MKALKERSGEDNTFVLLIIIIITGMVFLYRAGISGNDFWWHVKAGEWIINNKTLPNVDAFSWFARENGIIWISHEWLTEIVFYIIHNIFSDLGIYIISLFSAISMFTLIILKNKHGIKNNVWLSAIYLTPALVLFPEFFIARPQLISYFLLYATLFCLFSYYKNEMSKAIYFLPFISMLWSNFHGGSSSLPYILCFIFMFSGLFEFSVGKLTGEKLSQKQIKTYIIIGILSFLALAINPHGLKILIYPFTNMGDVFLQSIIYEWSSPDAKQLSQIFTFFLPLIVAGISLIITDKKIRVVDLLVFLFFAYLFFRSIRFSILFFIASTFFLFDYFMPKKINPMKTKADITVFYMLIVVLIGINIYSAINISNTFRGGKLISVALDTKFIELVKLEKPRRIYNDYNFGETLIYNNIDTFVDARADIFSKYNMHDAVNLLYLTNSDNNKKDKIFDPEEIISKYSFDAFLVEKNRSLTAYLKSKPEKYSILLEDDNAVYFKCIKAN